MLRIGVLLEERRPQAAYALPRKREREKQNRISFAPAAPRAPLVYHQLLW
jgi:hypothetical protein